MNQWHITYNPKPIPSRAHDWDWCHADYDGAPDSGDKRCGTAKSAADARRQIRLISSPPPQGQPQSVTVASVVLGALGFVLCIGALMALVWVAAERMGVL